MAKPSNTKEFNLDSYLKTVRGETVNYPALFEHIRSVVEMAEGVIVTTLPRGGLQIAQPQQVPESLLRSYVREFHAMDRPSWTAIAKQQPARALDCWSASEFQESRYYKDFLVPNGLAFAASAPLKAPVLDGYPGALTLFRTQQQGRFN